MLLLLLLHYPTICNMSHTMSSLVPLLLLLL